MSRTLAVLVNPTAGRGRSRRVGRRLCERLAAAGHRVVDVTGASAAAGAANLRAALSRESIDGIIAVGGDGVVNQAATAAVGVDVPLGIIPAGTGNDIARGLGLGRGARASIRRILNALDRAELPLQRVDVCAVSRGTAAAAGEEEYFLSVLTGGLGAAVNARANRMRFLRGKAQYLFALAAELRRYRSYDYEVTIAGQVHQKTVILLCVANLPYFGGGMKISPGAEATDSRLQLVLVRPIRMRTLLWVFPRIFWGGHVKHPAVAVIPLTSVSLKWNPEDALPVPFADGEPVTGSGLNLRVQPGALGVIVG